MFFSASRNVIRSKLLTKSGKIIGARDLNVHEYQCQQIMKKFGIQVPNGIAANTLDQVEKAATELGGKNLVLKAQILAGGRGLGHFPTSGLQGGVHLVDTMPELLEKSEKMLGHALVTKQTGKEGRKVGTVFISERYSVKREMYFSIILDRGVGGPVMIASPKGGVNIEDVAEKTPEFIFKEPIDPLAGPTSKQVARVAKGLVVGDGGKANEKVELALRDEINRLWKLFDETDASMIEINPLAELDGDRILCLDAKVNFDDNAEFRQKEIFAMRDATQEDSRENEAAKFDLSYIALDGNIGCMVNGAGLAMSCLDIVSHYGGSPANFLDVGGGATQKNVEGAFRIILSDPKVKAILVNIFGGIMKCDVIAAGVIGAAKATKLEIPLIVRLEGTNADIGMKLMEDSGLDIITANGMDEAARKAVAAVQP